MECNEHLVVGQEAQFWSPICRLFTVLNMNEWSAVPSRLFCRGSRSYANLQRVLLCKYNKRRGGSREGTAFDREDVKWSRVALLWGGRRIWAVCPLRYADSFINLGYWKIWRQHRREPTRFLEEMLHDATTSTLNFITSRNNLAVYSSDIHYSGGMRYCVDSRKVAGSRPGKLIVCCKFI
jgi:hypothetical protein